MRALDTYTHFFPSFTFFPPPPRARMCVSARGGGEMVKQGERSPPTSSPMQVACQAAPSGSLTAGSLPRGKPGGAWFLPARMCVAWPAGTAALGDRVCLGRPSAGRPRGGVGTPPRQGRDVGQRGRTRGQRERAVAGGNRGVARPRSGPSARANQSTSDPAIPGSAACAAGHHDAPRAGAFRRASERRSL